MTASEKAKEKRLQTIYKKSLAEFNKQLEEQKYRCACCSRPFPPLKDAKGKSFTPFNDHDHKCCPRRLKNYCGRCSRGLLCFICNKYVVGVLEKQNVDIDKVSAYLKKWKAILTERGCYAKEKGKKL